MGRRGPKWATPDRQAQFVRLFLKSGGFCVFGHRPCPIPEHHYELVAEEWIREWKAEDREKREAEWQELRRYLHDLGERRRPIREGSTQ